MYGVLRSGGRSLKSGSSDVRYSVGVGIRGGCVVAQAPSRSGTTNATTMQRQLTVRLSVCTKGLIVDSLCREAHLLPVEGRADRRAVHAEAAECLVRLEAIVDVSPDGDQLAPTERVSETR